MDRMPDLPENLVNPGKLQTTTQSSGAGKEYTTAFGWYWPVQPVPETKKKRKTSKRKTANRKKTTRVAKKTVKSLPKSKPWWQFWG